MISIASNSSLVKTYSPAFICEDFAVPSYCIGEVILKLAPEKTRAQLDSVVESLEYSIKDSDLFVKEQFIVSINEKDGNKTLEAANLLFETGLFEFAEPNFLVDNAFNTSDPLFQYQWGLKNTGQNGGIAGVDINVEPAWGITTGSANIVVAVVDNGVQLDHPDLTANLISGYDATGNGTNGGPLNNTENHGTACAGIIGASHNNYMVAGIAPSCKILPIHVTYGNYYTNSWLASGINYAVAHNASIISNSWGGGAFSTVIDNAIKNAIENGRNGKGCVVVFASGNSNRSEVEYPSSTNGVIAVGGVDRCGQRSGRSDITEDPCDPWPNNYKPGSSFGSKLSIVAPGTNVYTTTIGSSYVSNFGGTSAACPHVAGVASLILSANQNLTYLQVKQIIEVTARKTGNYDYQLREEHPNGTWNNKTGYGMVDAYAAVQMAQSYDLFVRDSENDNGITSSNAQIMWDSPDIWIEDASGNVCNPHGNTLCYVCVRIWNNSDISSCGDERLFLNWAKAGCDLRWNYNWTGNNYFDCGNSPVKGGVIDSGNGIPIPSIAAHQSRVVRIEWRTPMAEDYAECTQFDSDRWHFCLVARIHDGDEILYENSSNADMGTFTTHNNNVAWKNISILDAQYNTAVVSFSNPFDFLQRFRLHFRTRPNKAGDIIFKHADVLIRLDDELVRLWKDGGGVCVGGKYLGENRFLVQEPDFYLENIVMPIGRHYTVEAGVRFFTQTTPLCNEFEFDIIEEGEKEIIGGEHYLAIKDSTKRFKAIALENKTVLAGDSTSFTAQAISEDAQYTWFSTVGDTLAIGDLLQTSQNTTRQYILEVVSIEDNYKDVDTVTVTVRRAAITALTPNPANNQTVVSYRLASDVTSASIVIANATGQVLYSAPLDVTQTTHTVNLQAIPTGQYTVRIESQGSPLDSKTLIVY
ncbi:MAG: S8 family serine peptidase [Bacteroidales bacterium]|nr:S8 family serine peptidase [Bacteroidales bacterium]